MRFAPLLLLACCTLGPTEPHDAGTAAPAPAPAAPRDAAPEAPATPVDVTGSVSGWDGTGDVAIEACGRGALVDPSDHSFAMRTETGCDLRVVWEREGHRAVGAWHDQAEGRPTPPIADDGTPAVHVVLPMPEAAALMPLTEAERAYRREVIREAQDRLLEPVTPEESGSSRSPAGV